MDTCPCNSGNTYEKCCKPFISGEQEAQTPETLMRSRYTAFAKSEIPYILQTIHPEKRSQHDEKSIRKWAEKSQWLGLEILDVQDGGPDDDQGTVEFIALYMQKSGRVKHHEIAQFKKDDDKWYFYDAAAPEQKQVKREGPKVGRNDPCPCGSGKKYKKCCLS